MNFWCIFFLHKKYQGSLRRALVSVSNTQVWSHFLCWLLTGHGCTVLFLFCFFPVPTVIKPKAITHWFQTLKHCHLVQGSGTLQCHLGVVCWVQHTLYSYSHHLFPEMGLQSYLRVSSSSMPHVHLNPCLGLCGSESPVEAFLNAQWWPTDEDTFCGKIT